MVVESNSFDERDSLRKRAGFSSVPSSMLDTEINTSVVRIVVATTADPPLGGGLLPPDNTDRPMEMPIRHKTAIISGVLNLLLGDRL
jgi:hypothetical protein